VSLSQVVIPPGTTFYDVLKDFGFPALVALVLLTQVLPKVDAGIVLASRVDLELQYIALKGCSASSPPTPS